VLAKLKTDATLVQRESENKEHNLPGDKFTAIMKQFSENSTQQVEEITDYFNKTDNNFKACAKYYGEQPTIDTTDFFEIVRSFLSAIEKAKVQNRRASKK